MVAIPQSESYNYVAHSVLQQPLAKAMEILTAVLQNLANSSPFFFLLNMHSRVIYYSGLLGGMATVVKSSPESSTTITLHLE